ncbi:Casein kinase I isoform gamma-2 [Myotis davidii]|uniref:Casein kinase I isoform gamma-2 n=1 Tax=Myotis davidii TaxID=225400 RepID=L5LY89_MYODS|nr:Casein kinase I isoform gamma-2 [Myotis davidii]
MIAIQLITCMECVHTKSVICRDVQPEDFLVRRRAASAARRPHHRLWPGPGVHGPGTKKRNPRREHKSLKGTARPMRSAHTWARSRAPDNLEALGHSPWAACPGRAQGRAQRALPEIGDTQRAVPIEVLCESHPEEMARTRAVYLRRRRLGEA